MDPKKIGRLIAKRRKEIGMTQQELADQLSVTNKAVSKWERGQGIPDISLLKNLAASLEITVDELLEGEEEEIVLVENDSIEEYVFTKNDYFQYLKEESYHKRLRKGICFIIGILCIFGGIVFKEIDRYTHSHLDIIGIIILIVGVCVISYCCLIQYIQKAMFHEKKVSYSLNGEGILYQEAGNETMFYYNQLSFMYELDNILILKVNHQILGIDKKYLGLLKEKAIQLIDYTSSDYQKRQYKAIIGMMSVFIICMCLLLGYHVVLKRLGFEIISQGINIALWVMIVLCTIYSFVLFTCQLKVIHVFIMIILAGVCLSGSFITGNTLSSDKTIYSLSPHLNHQLVMKKNRFNGKLKYYHYTFLCFAKQTDEMDGDLNFDITTQWITDDCNIITYTNNNQNEYFVATYGDRGNSLSYHNVLGSMQGQWIKKDESDLDYTMSVDDHGVVVEYKNQEKKFLYADAKQNGTIAVTLRDINKRPHYVLVMNENCEFNQDYILKNDGSIQLVVLNDNLKSVEMFCTTYKKDEDIQNQIDDAMKDKAKSLIKKMQNILKEDKTLKTYQSTYDLFKVETESEDIFEVVRLAYLEDIGKDLKLSGHVGIDQITNISIKAGTINDFYVEVQADTSLKNKATGEVIKNGYIPSYRIMKGDGCYLVGRITYRVPGDVGLSPLVEVREKDVSKDEKYCFVRES